MSSDVAVVGSGIVGATTVWRLARAGHRVSWVTGTAAHSATTASGAMLSVYSEVSAHQSQDTIDVEVRTRREGRERWQGWLTELGVSTTPGIHVIARTAPDLASLDAIADAAAAHGGRVETVEPTSVPGLHPDAGFEAVRAIHLPDEASLDSGVLLAALRAAALALPGVVVVPDDAVGVDGDGVRTTVSGRVSAGQVVLAAGSQTSELLARSGLSGLLPPVLGGRGASVLVQPLVAAPGCVRTPNRAFACGLHSVPRSGGLTYLGATNRLTTTPQAALGPQISELDDLLGGCVRELDRRLRRAEVLATSVGHRPVTADRLPLVGRLDEPWLLVATATWRNGVVLAPLLADLITDEVAEPGTTAKHPFAASRTIIPAPLDAATIERAARGLAASVLGEGVVAPGRASDLEAFFAHALTREVQGPDRRAARLLERAPMEEVLPLLFDLLARRVT
ncbi:MAG: FAD-dependent oxidoreductase [Pseudonocardiales bacterium]